MIVIRTINAVVVEVMRFLPRNHTLGAVILFLVLTIVLSAYFFLIGMFRPRLIDFEFSRSPAFATWVLGQWRSVAATGLAKATVIMDTFVVLPTVAAFFAYLCIWAAASMRSDAPWLTALGALAACAPPAALVVGISENTTMMVMIMRGGAKGAAIACRILASAKYALFALSATFLLFRAEYFVYEKLAGQVRNHPVWWLVGLAFAWLCAGLLVFRLGAALNPPIGRLQLAPSSAAADRLLQRWGRRRRMIAEQVNAADVLLAVVYSETLAVFSFYLADVFLKQNRAIFAVAARGVGWFMILAGTCHVAQNIGAHAALVVNRMGWWLQVCRACGSIRVGLLFIGGAWFGFLVLWKESILVRDAMNWIQAAVGTGSPFG